VLAVGDELLSGHGTDSNSAWLSARLVEMGVHVGRHVTVGDDQGELVTALAEATARADIVVTTGGLGPTHDDRTRQAIAELAGAQLQRREELADRLEELFAARGRTMPASNLVQADLPVDATVLTPTGTAAGFCLDVGGALVVCLPGVPHEMQTMFADGVVEELRRRGASATTVTRVVHTAGMAESAVAEACADVVADGSEDGNPAVAFLASRGETRVRVTATAPTRAAAAELTDPVVERVVALLGAAVTGVDDEGVELAVARTLQAAGWSLAVAESVTGGGIGARLVRVAGASDWFRGGLITYATEAKRAVARLEAQTLADGAVSEATAAELARSAAARFGADVGLAAVGVAGPSAQEGHSPGTLCLGAELPVTGVVSRTVTLPAPDRVAVQQFAASSALDYLRRRLVEVAPPAELTASSQPR
jgi:nicotinamide-nucleotide amidase